MESMTKWAPYKTDSGTFTPAQGVSNMCKESKRSWNSQVK